MGNKMFYEELIFLDKSINDSDEFFEFVFPILKEKGYVRDTFLSSIKEREMNYPTALPMEPCPIALPHTDTEHVIKPFISVTRLQGTTPWHEMANNDNIIQVNFVFLLGLVDKNAHVNLLQSLISGLSDEQFIRRIKEAKTSREMIQILESSIQF